MMIRLTLLCHGRTTARPSMLPADEPLMDGERDRITALAPTLAAADHVLSAPALAARQTAELVSRAFAIEQALADIALGSWAGRRMSEIADSESGSLSKWMDDPDYAPVGGESHGALLARVAAWLENGLNREGHTLAVTHPRVVRATVVMVLGTPAAAMRNIDLEHLGRAVLTSDGRRWALRSLGGP